MKRIKLLAGISLLVAAMATPSLAADLPRPAYKAPLYAPPAVFSWSGAYVGAFIGYGWGESRWLDGAGGTPWFDVDGWTGGGTLGYNIQAGSLVYGIEGDAGYAEIKGTTSAGSCVGAVCQTRNTWLATVRGRLGYAMGSFMPYITGGAAFGGVRMSMNALPRQTETAIGWTVGGGLEYAFMGGLSAKLEYLYADLGDVDCSAASCGIATRVEYKTNLVRAGINYRF